MFRDSCPNRYRIGIQDRQITTPALDWNCCAPMLFKTKALSDMLSNDV